MATRSVAALGLLANNGHGGWAMTLCADGDIQGALDWDVPACDASPGFRSDAAPHADDSRSWVYQRCLPEPPFGTEGATRGRS